MAVLVGCKQQNDKLPDNLVPQQKMVQILADVHIAEARIETKVLYPDTALMAFNKEEKRILEAHGVKEADFRKTYQYYLNNLPKMDKLYEIILDTLSVREAQAKVREEHAAKAKIVQDSLDAVKAAQLQDSLKKTQDSTEKKTP